MSGLSPWEEKLAMDFTLEKNQQSAMKTTNDIIFDAFENCVSQGGWFGGHPMGNRDLSMKERACIKAFTDKRREGVLRAASRFHETEVKKIQLMQENLAKQQAIDQGK